jgi:hypothetical protein
LPLRKLYEQDQILNEAGLKTEAFDKEVEDLSNVKIRVAVEAKFLELHILTLQQELIILRGFEDVEDKVSNKVLNSLKEKYELQRMVCLSLALCFHCMCSMHNFSFQDLSCHILKLFCFSIQYSQCFQPMCTKTLE